MKERMFMLNQSDFPKKKMAAVKSASHLFMSYINYTYKINKSK
ncbi:hypothetical protein B4144_2583 [Bacillus atrophaeus]|nr:hypothetical protein D068_cds25640 [Bacillus atrophaeus UCMB-5137]KYD02096.1 hypothetical protein B4144_2583 [Bacillus atrophaeus]